MSGGRKQYACWLLMLLALATCAICEGHGQPSNGQGWFDIQARFEPAEVTLGKECVYEISIRRTLAMTEGRLTAPVQPELPPNVHLTFGRYQTSEEYISSMGTDPGGVKLEFRVNPNTAGRIIMPSFLLDYQGQKLRVPAAVLRVRMPDAPVLQDSTEWVRLELEAQPDEMWVGQKYRTSLNLLILDGLQNVTYGKPEHVGNDLALESISPSPLERLVTRGDLRYRVYSWPLTFSPLRSGLVQVTFRASVNLRMPNNRREFLRWVRERDTALLEERERILQDYSESSFTVFSESRNVRVSSLGMPDPSSGYYGGIGRFEFGAELATVHLEVGKPVDLVIEVKGEGNFGKLEPPVLRLGDAWRVFPPTPSFTDEDHLGYRGKMRYQYVLIPMTADIVEFPGLAYRYFDVTEKAFKDLTTMAIGVHVKGLAGAVEPAVTPAAQSKPAARPVRDPALSENVYELPVSRLRWEMGSAGWLKAPMHQNRQFWLIQGVLVVVAWGYFYGRIRRGRMVSDARFARIEQSRGWMRQYLRLARSAASRGDADGFFEDAYLAMCGAVAVRSRHNVEAITAVELHELARSGGESAETLRIIQYYVDHYERSRFSGAKSDIPPLAPECERVAKLCRALHRRACRVKGETP